jgi:hypothetical protein
MGSRAFSDPRGFTEQLGRADTTMSKRALESEKVREGLKDVLLGPAGLYEALRERGEGDWQRPRSIKMGLRGLR